MLNKSNVQFMLGCGSSLFTKIIQRGNNAEKSTLAPHGCSKIHENKMLILHYTSTYLSVRVEIEALVFSNKLSNTKPVNTWMGEHFTLPRVL